MPRAGSIVRLAARAGRSFLPSAMPRMSRAHYAREIGAWALLAVLFGAIDGGVSGVVAKNAFEGVVETDLLDGAVALLTAIGAFANLLSFAWAALARGRSKIRFIVALQALAVVAVAQAGLAPRAPLGLVMLMVATLGAGVAWSGIVTIRATVWRMNYSLDARTHLTANLATVQSLVIASVAVAIGIAMRTDPRLLHVIYPLAAVAGIAGMLLFSRVRVRRHRRLLEAERVGQETRRAFASPRTIVRLVREDPKYGAFLAAMTVFGTGNVATTAPLVILLRDQFEYSYLRGILVMTAIPTLTIPLVVPLWAALLRRAHVVHFRAIHSWVFGTFCLVMLLACLLDVPALAWIAAVIKGAAFAGGAIAWNLGHIDFAPEARTSEYMGAHVTLEGVRGFIGPIVGLGTYKLIESHFPGQGAWTFAVAFALNSAGAVWFGLQSRAMGDARWR